MHRDSLSNQLLVMIESVFHFVNNKMPSKTRHFIANEVVCMAKKLSKAKMTRLWLKNLHVKTITENKTSTKTAKPEFSDKQVLSGKTNIFNIFVANLVQNLNIKMNDSCFSDTENVTSNVNI